MTSGRIRRLIGLMLLAATAAAQQGELTLRSTSRLVQISVIVKDKSGTPLLDLRPEDFDLSDNGHKRDIRVFTLDQKRAVTAAPSPSGARIFSNRDESRFGANGITVIVIDSVNTKWADQSYAAKQIIEFLKQIHPDDRIAIYSLGFHGFRVLHDFTRDSSDIIEALAYWKGKLPEPAAGHGRPDPGSALDQVLNGDDPSHRNAQMVAPNGGYDIHATEDTIRTMEAISNRLAGIPGRKNLIWISDGFPVVEWGNLAITGAPGPGHSAPNITDVHYLDNMIHATDSFGSMAGSEDLLGHAMRLMNRANIAVYPLEARGLGSGSVYEDGAEQAMLEIADKSGGRAFVRTNDLAHSIRAAIEDSSVMYTLGFYLDSGVPDGKYHQLKLKVARPGVQVRHQRGYMDDAEPASEPKRRKNELDRALWSPLDANAVALTAEMRPASANNARLHLNIGAGHLSLPLKGERRTGAFDILIAQRNREGQDVSRINETVELDLREPTYEQFQKTGVPYERSLVLDSKSAGIRVVVRDPSNGNVGSLTIPREP